VSREQFCTFLVDGRLFAVEIEHVQEVLREQVVTAIPLAPAVVRGLINLRGEIIPALDLRVRLELPPAGDGASNVVLRTPMGLVSVLVDEIGDVLDLAAAQFEPPPPSLDGPARRLIRGVYEREQELILALEPRAVWTLGELVRVAVHDPNGGGPNGGEVERR